MIYDLEKEAQAKYNAKLTKQQNMCMSSNTGGVMGNRENGSTFLWVKLKSNTVPKNYAVSGLKTSQFAASNDIYGSFCRVRVTLHSDDKKIQDVIAKGTDWAVAYFAAGDAFTCGSWIPEKALTQLADAVAKDARDTEAKGDSRTRNWMAVLGTVGGGLGGAAIGSKIADSNFLGGLTGQSSVKDNNTNAENCVKAGDNYATTKDTAYLTRMLNYARKIDTSKSDDKKELTNAISDLRDAVMFLQTTPSTSSAYTDVVKEYIDGYKQTNSECPSGYEVEYVTIYYADCSQQAGKYTGCGDSNSSEFIIGETKPFIVNESTIRQKFAYKCYRNVQKTLSGTTNTTNNTAELNKKVSALSNACEAYTNNKSNQKTKSIATAVGVGVTAIAGGVLAYQATKSIQEAKLDKVEQAAYDEWMNEVGNHIRCFVGGDEVGMYGDIISTSME